MRHTNTRKAWIGVRVTAIVGLAAAFGGWAARPTADFEAAVPSSRAAALVEATSSPISAQLRATGEKAKFINAAMPFATSPVASLRPFSVDDTSTDGGRALLCLTQAVYYEAGFEPIAGRRAVAQVVLNRLRHPAFPKSICGVVYQRSASRICQFTFVCDGALYRPPEASTWRQAHAIAKAALSGYVEQSVGSSTHYHANYVAPRWAPMLAKVAQIGAHIFYRWPGAWGQPQAFVGRYIGEPSDPAALRPSYRAFGASEAQKAVVIAEAGPPVRRAPNDLGGLVDTSKGWTLRIPDPRQMDSAASRVIAEQQKTESTTTLATALAVPTLSGGR